MDELEKERQLFLEDSKKEKWQRVTKIGLVLIAIFIIMTVDLLTNSGIEITEDFYKFEGLFSFFDYHTIYFYIFIFISIICTMLVIIKFSKGYSQKAYQRYKQVYKRQIVLPALNEIFEDAQVYDGGFSSKDMSDIGLINIGTHYKSEDSFKGKYNKVPFEAAEIYTYHKVYRNDRNEKVIDFNGNYYIFEFNKNFKGNMKVFPEGETSRSKEKGIKIADLDLENIKFNEKFRVITEDEHLAYYILTPQLMEKMIKLNEEFIDVSFAFIDNKLHMAVSTTRENLFEFSPYEKLNIEEETKSVKESMIVLTQIVDMLNLDNDLFK